MLYKTRVIPLERLEKFFKCFCFGWFYWFAQLSLWGLPYKPLAPAHLDFEVHNIMNCIIF